MQAASSPHPAFESWPRRLLAAGLFLGAFAWLVFGSQLEANPYGTGTHQQLGLGQCGFEMEYGIACPTCGMTTAFTLATQGRLIAAFATQPAGALFTILLAAAGLLAAWVAISGYRTGPLLTRLAVRWRAIAVVTVILLAGSWLLQIMQG